MVSKQFQLPTKHARDVDKGYELFQHTIIYKDLILCYSYYGILEYAITLHWHFLYLSKLETAIIYSTQSFTRFTRPLPIGLTQYPYFKTVGSKWVLYPSKPGAGDRLFPYVKVGDTFKYENNWLTFVYIECYWRFDCMKYVIANTV